MHKLNIFILYTSQAMRKCDLCLLPYANNKGADQRLKCSLPRQNDTSSLYIRNFKILASLCSWAGQFVSSLVGDLREHIFSWGGLICKVSESFSKSSGTSYIPMYALSKQKQNKQTGKNGCRFVKNYFFWHKTSSCKCSMCLYYVGKVSDSFSQNSGTSCACTIWALTKPLLRSKVLKNG